MKLMVCMDQEMYSYRPAFEGTGIIAGGPVRAVVELAGYSDIISKSIGSRTPINMVRATVEGLKLLKTVQQVAELRDKKVEEITDTEERKKWQKIIKLSLRL